MAMSEASFASLGPTLLARKGGAKPAMRPQLTPLPENISQLANLAEEQLEDLGWNDMGEGDLPPHNGEDPAVGDDAEGLAAGFDPSPLLARKSASGADESEIIDHDSDEPGTDIEMGGFEIREEEGEDTETGPHMIIDPLGGAEIVPITSRKGHTLHDHASTKNEHPANENWAEEDFATGEGPEEGPLLRKKNAAARSNPAQRSEDQPAPAQASGKASGKSGRRAAFTLRLDPERHLKLRLASTLRGVSAQSLVTEALDALLGEIEELDMLVDRMKRN